MNLLQMEAVKPSGWPLVPVTVPVVPRKDLSGVSDKHHQPSLHRDRAMTPQRRPIISAKRRRRDAAPDFRWRAGSKSGVTSLTWYTTASASRPPRLPCSLPCSTEWKLLNLALQIHGSQHCSVLISQNKSVSFTK